MDEKIDIETIRIEAMFLHVSRTIEHWGTLQRKPTITHRNKLMKELEEIKSLSSKEVLATQGVI